MLIPSGEPLACLPAISKKEIRIYVIIRFKNMLLIINSLFHNWPKFKTIWNTLFSENVDVYLVKVIPL